MSKTNELNNFVWQGDYLVRKTLWVEFGNALIQKYGLVCFYCGRSVLKTTKQKANQATIDHIIAKANGGTTSLENLVIACFCCNQEKGDEVDFLTMFRRKAKERTQNRIRRKG